jgi:hypothetical protein
VGPRRQPQGARAREPRRGSRGLCAGGGEAGRAVDGEPRREPRGPRHGGEEAGRGRCIGEGVVDRVRGRGAAGATRRGAGAGVHVPREREGEGGSEEGGGGAYLGIQRSVITVHWITPTAKEVEERWKRGRGSCCVGKENEIERGRWGARGQTGNPLHARPVIERKSRIENQNEAVARLNTTLDKRNMLRH